MNTLQTNYLVIGSGAMGMAFVDTLLDETESDIIMVDRFAKPGGHWNKAYPFVTLHQPSAFYGVASKELGAGRRDLIGLNKGLAELATGADVLSYFEDVMRHKFLPSGRVQYFPLCNYDGEGGFTSKLAGHKYQVSYDKLVDCTLLNTNIPATHTPNFTVAKGAQFIPLNDLPDITVAPAGYVVIGGGKTGVDCLLWLLEQGVDPNIISWVVSRDGWYLDRENTQNHPDFWHKAIGTQAAMFEAIAGAKDRDDMFLRLEDCGYFLRIDPNVRPTMFHGPTISKMELAELRKIKNIIRKGRVQNIGLKEITLTEGTVPTSKDHIHIDCSASAIKDYTAKAVFDGNVINPQTVRAYQPVFSGSFIAHIEASDRSIEDKNALCGVVPLPDSLDDFILMTAANMMNQALWGQHKELRHWMRQNRLDGFSGLMSGIDPDDGAKMATLTRLRSAAMPAMQKLQTFMLEL